MSYNVLVMSAVQGKDQYTMTKVDLAGLLWTVVHCPTPEHAWELAHRMSRAHWSFADESEEQRFAVETTRVRLTQGPPPVPEDWKEHCPASEAAPRRKAPMPLCSSNSTSDGGTDVEDAAPTDPEEPAGLWGGEGYIPPTVKIQDFRVDSMGAAQRAGMWEDLRPKLIAPRGWCGARSMQRFLVFVGRATSVAVKCAV